MNSQRINELYFYQALSSWHGGSLEMTILTVPLIEFLLVKGLCFQAMMKGSKAVERHGTHSHGTAEISGIHN